MTLREIRSDIMLLAQHSKISKDKNLWESHIEFLIPKYRTTIINQIYNKEGMIDPMWIQDIGISKINIIDAAQEVSLLCAGLMVGKIVLPNVLPLKNQNGVVRVSGSSRQQTYYGISLQRYFEMDSTSMKAKFRYFFREGNAFYLTPPPAEAHFSLILDNPMEGSFFDNTIQTVIHPDFVYKVTEGGIKYNGITYQPGNTFVGVYQKTSYQNIGSGGKVYFNETRRPMTIDDQYPVSFNVAQMIISAILTTDFAIETKAVADLKNDNQESLKIQE